MNYKKITETQARKMHAEGKTVYCLPSKVNHWSTWWWPTPPEIPTDRDFDKFCNEYQCYNCNAETGRRLAFYKEVI